MARPRSWHPPTCGAAWPTPSPAHHATVNSVLTSAVDDPHSFEASPADAAEIADAALVVYNGGGYDHWVDDVLANYPDVAAVNAYSLLNSTDGPANEHVFYDMGVAKAVATRIADRLAEVDPDHAGDYRANAAEFGKQADTILSSERAIAQAHPGAAVVATEPVAYYLLRNAGVADRTPPGFASLSRRATTRHRPTSRPCWT